MKALPIAALALAIPAAAQAQRAQPITITMTDHGFDPHDIVLRAGAPYVLRVVNPTDKGHNLTQEVFLHQARIAGPDRFKLDGNKLVVAAHAQTVIHFLAPDNRHGATYAFSSTVLSDADNDYKGAFHIR